MISDVIHPCDPFLIINRSVTGNSVEEHCFVALNVKLQVKLRFKTFYRLLKLLYTVLAFNTTNNTTCFAQNFCIF